VHLGLIIIMLFIYLYFCNCNTRLDEAVLKLVAHSNDLGEKCCVLACVGLVMRPNFSHKKHFSPRLSYGGPLP